MANQRISELEVLSPVADTDYTIVYDVDAGDTKRATKADFKGADGTNGTDGADGADGVVQTIGVTTANGVSAVSSGGADPRLTVTLGSITPSAIQVSGLTASEIVGTDGSKNLVSLAVATYPSLTELSYVKGVSSAIQTQLGTKVTSGGALGTPSSGTLTNCTGLPVAGITASTSTALGVGSIELGHASDTTISKSAAGVIAVEGVVIPSISSTNTLTNKRITQRVSAEASSATPTINTDNVDAHSITAIGTDITSMSSNLSGTPTNFQKLIIRFKDDGTARAIAWGTSFEARGVALPTTTVISKVLTVGFIYDTVTSKWGCVASAQEE